MAVVDRYKLRHTLPTHRLVTKRSDRLRLSRAAWRSTFATGMTPAFR